WPTPTGTSATPTSTSPSRWATSSSPSAATSPTRRWSTGRGPPTRPPCRSGSELAMTFAVTPTAPTGYVDPAAVLDRLEPGAPGRSNGATGFAATLGAVVDNTQALQAASNELAIAAVTGDLADIH